MLQDATSARPRRILLISSVLPWPLHRNGGAQRTALMRRALRDAGRAVDVLGLIPQPAPQMPDPETLRRHGVVAAFPIELDPPASKNRLGRVGGILRLREQWRFRYSPVREASRWVADRMMKYEAIYVRYLQTALWCGLDRRDPASPPPVLVDLDDVDWLTLANRFQAQPWPGLAGRVGMQMVLRQVRGRGLRALPAFNELFVASQEDAAELPARLGVSVLPNIPYEEENDAARHRPLPPAGSRRILFVGDLEFGPNRTGVEWFLNQCWPHIRSLVPEATLRIVGRGLDDTLREAWSSQPGVEPVGFVEDLRAEYAACACTIAPTWWGGGTKIKLVESAALGRASVATPHGARGYGVLAQPPTPAIVIAADAEAFSSAVMRLLRDEAYRQSLSQAGPQLVWQHFSYRRFSRLLQSSLARADASMGIH